MSAAPRFLEILFLERANMGDVKLSNDKENESHRKKTILHFGILNYQNTNQIFLKIIQINHKA